MRRAIAVLAAVGAALAVATPASADQVAVANACWWTVPGEWNNETLTFAGTPSAARAGAGNAVTLSGLSARIVFPREVIDIGFAIGLLKAGENEIPVRAWAAIRGMNTAEGLRVLETTATARTTIVADAEGAIVSATPIEVVAPFPDTQWTLAADAASTFAQAEAGTLPALPVGRTGGPLTPKGSVYVAAKVGASELQLDCQPGVRSEDRTGPLAGPAVPFATMLAPDDTPPVAAPKPKPSLVLRTTKLKAKDGTVAVRLSCAAAPCAGTVRLVRSAKTSATRTLRYSFKPGEARTLKLRLTATTRKLLRKRSLSVRVVTVPAVGDALSKRYTLPRVR